MGILQDLEALSTIVATPVLAKIYSTKTNSNFIINGIYEIFKENFKEKFELRLPSSRKIFNYYSVYTSYDIILSLVEMDEKERFSFQRA